MKLFKLSSDCEERLYAEPELAEWTWLENPELQGIHRFDQLETLCRWAMNAMTGETYQIGRIVVTCVGSEPKGEEK